MIRCIYSAQCKNRGERPYLRQGCVKNERKSGVYTQTTLNLGKAASERSPRNAHLVHGGGERVQPTQHKFKVGRVDS